MCKSVLYILVFLYLQLSFAQESKSTIDSQELDLIIQKGLKFLENNQRSSSNYTAGQIYFKGEWPSKMGLKVSFFLLGKKRFVDDSNCFAVASTHNVLANIYLRNPKYENIIPMLKMSMPRILAYKNDNKFNFWNALTPYRKLKKSDVIGQQPLVRRPTNFKLKSKYINNAANIVEDADDTALGYIALKLYAQVTKQDSIIPSSEVISVIFENYRDINRKNRHWYNYLNGNDFDTGAFLTWLGEEYKFKKWNIIKVIAHNATFFLPFSECFPRAYVPYIPYGSNDLDAVVNANVLNVLANYDALNTKGTEDAIRYLNKKSSKKKYDRLGIYYPNRYQFPYAVANAYCNGVKSLEPAKNNIVKFLISKQHKDGSWSARKIVNKKDILQSTAYAVNALLNFDGMNHAKTRISIEKGIQFLINSKSKHKDEFFWKGGVFFSGGTVVRNTLYWKSDAFTTAIVLNAFSSYNYLLKNQ
jgi:hypothetical protein